MFFIRCHEQLLKTALNQLQASKVVVAGISTTVFDMANYYDDLGIPSNSTQTDIKAAYYELSKLYHPDKNQGCDTSAKKFREITRAYEVLGNYRLRRLYDKGIIQTPHSEHARPHYEVDEEKDDPETKFYKSRFTKSTVSDMSGRTPIYNFDEWAKAHYGVSFDRKQTAKMKHKVKSAEKHSHKMSFQTEMVILGIIFGLLSTYMFLSRDEYDSPRANSPVKQD